jgi:hypothetical protein
MHFVMSKWKRYCSPASSGRVGRSGAGSVVICTNARGRGIARYRSSLSMSGSVVILPLFPFPRNETAASPPGARQRKVMRELLGIALRWEQQVGTRTRVPKARITHSFRRRTLLECSLPADRSQSQKIIFMGSIQPITICVYFSLRTDGRRGPASPGGSEAGTLG